MTTKDDLKDVVNIVSIPFGILVIILGLYLDTLDPAGLTFADVTNLAIGFHITFSGIRNL